MNKQEIEKAIDIIDGDKEAFKKVNHGGFTNKIKAFELAISALTQQLNNGWIPIPPPTGTECLVQTVNNEILHVYYAGDCKYHFMSSYDKEIRGQAKYWQPLPEKYKAD